MKTGKVEVPSGVSSDLLKLCGKESVKRLKNMINGLFIYFISIFILLTHRSNALCLYIGQAITPTWMFVKLQVCRIKFYLFIKGREMQVL